MGYGKVTRYGWYSDMAEHLGGSSVYSTPNGGLVRVTAVFDKKDLDQEDYDWKDRRYVGEVCEWVKTDSYGIIGKSGCYPPADRVAFASKAEKREEEGVFDLGKVGTGILGRLIPAYSRHQ